MALLRHPLLKALALGCRRPTTGGSAWVTGATFLMHNEAHDAALGKQPRHELAAGPLRPPGDSALPAVGRRRPHRVGRRVPWFQEWLAHNTYDDYWKAISNERISGDMEVAAFSQCGWYGALILAPPSSISMGWWSRGGRSGCARISAC